MDSDSALNFKTEAEFQGKELKFPNFTKPV